MSKALNIKKINIDAFLYAFGDFAVVGVTGFLLLPLYTNLLSKEDFGKYSIIIANVSIFSYLFILGIPSAASRLYFDFKKKGTHLDYIGGLVVLHLLYSIFMVGTFYVFGETMWSILSPGLEVYPFMWIACFWAFLSFVPELYLLLFRLEGRARSFLIAQLVKICIYCLLVFWFLVFQKGGLNELLFAQILTSLLFWLFFLGLFVSKLKWKVSFSSYLPTLKLAFPFFLSYIAFFVNQKFSLITLQRFVPFEEIALFSFGQQVAMVLTLANGAVVKAIQPVIYTAEINDLPTISNFLGYRYKLFMLFVCSSLIVFSSLMVKVLAGEHYLGSELYIALIGISGLAFTFAAVENSIIIYFKQTKMLFLGILSGAILNVMLNVLLIPKWGALGAAISMVLSAISVSIISFAFCRKLLRINSNYKSISFYFVVCTFLISVSKSIELHIDGFACEFIRALIFIVLLGSFIYLYRRSNQTD